MHRKDHRCLSDPERGGDMRRVNRPPLIRLFVFTWLSTV